MAGQQRAYPEGEHDEWREIPTPQKLLYGNQDLYGMMLHLQYRWYGTRSHDEFQRDLRDALADAFEADVIVGFAQGNLRRLKRCALEILYTRPKRWRDLALFAGLAACPSGFMVYRASNEAHATVAVLEAWASELVHARIPHAGLSSWSLLEGDARSGALTHLEPQRNGVLLAAQVPVENTFMDVLVDDGFFARYGIRECEVIVGIGDPSLEVLGYVHRCRVRLEGVNYRYRDRRRAIEHARLMGVLR